MRALPILLLALAPIALQAQSPVVASGQVADAATGLPIEDASVSIAEQMRYTDSGGRYTLDPVAPGSSAVRIEAKGYLSFTGDIAIAADQAIHDFKLVQAARISGRIAAPDSEWRREGFVVKLLQEDFTDGVRRFVIPTDRGQTARRTVSRIDDNGNFEFSGLTPGRYIIDAGPQTGTLILTQPGKDGKPVPAKHADEGYVQTYFPGTPDFAAAIPITIGSGENRIADITLARQPLYRVSGEMEGAAGEGETIQVEALGSGRIYTGAVSGAKFAIDGLPPGEYWVRDVIVPDKSQPGAPGAFRVLMRYMQMDPPFSVTDHDLAGLVVRPLPPRSGPVTTAGQFRLTGGGVLPGSLSVQFAYPNPGGESSAIAASPDGVFWLSDAPNEYSVRPIAPPAYAVTEIRYAGGNYPFSLIPLGSGPGDASITIVLSDQPASVSGVLTDDSGKPLAAKIALLPDPIPDHFDFRAIRVAATNDRGGFVMGGLAPGRYKAVVLTGDDRRQDHDMTLIGPRLGLADAFELTAGQNLTINPRP